MRLAHVETVCPAGLPNQLPSRTLQTASHSGSILKLIVMLPAAIALLMPFLLVAERLASDAAFRDILMAKQGAALQLSVGLAFWSLLFGWPLVRLAQSFARMRTVHLDADRVTVMDSGLFRHTTWQAPISEFSGIAHHIRSSLSSVRHELVLVHPSRDRSVLLAIAPRFTQTEIDHMCALLVCREIPSHALYKMRLPAIGWLKTAAPRRAPLAPDASEPVLQSL